MNQRERVLTMLKASPVCGTDFLNAYIPRYSARILELRQAGHIITTRPCKNAFHDWHNSAQMIYELQELDQLSLSL